MPHSPMDEIAIASQLGSDEHCLEFIKRLRWPDGIRCLECGSAKVAAFEVKVGTRQVRRATGKVETVAVPARHLYECPACGHQFTATTGTLFHDSHLSLTKWFFAVALMIEGNNLVTARQMKSHLKVSYRTAWYLCRRIRHAMYWDSDRS